MSVVNDPNVSGVDYVVPYVDLSGSVLLKFKGLMDKSIGSSSIYKAVVDNIEVIAADDKFSTTEKSKLIAEMASGIVDSLTSSSMDVGFQMAKEARDIMFSKPLAAADILYKNAVAENADAEDELNDAEAEKYAHEFLKAKVKAREEFGMGVDNWYVSGLDQTLPVDKYGLKLTKAKSAQAKTLSMYQKSFRENGALDFTGYDTRDTIGSAPGGSVQLGFHSEFNQGLIYNQSKVQHRNYFAYFDNKEQHLTNSLASLIGAFYTEDNAGQATSELICYWNQSRARLTGGFPDSGVCYGGVDAIKCPQPQTSCST